MDIVSNKKQLNMKKYVTILLAILLILCVELMMLLGCRNKDIVPANSESANYDYEENDQDELSEINIEDKDIVDISKSEYTYNEMVEDLNLLNNRYKGKMHLDVIGTTYDYRNIYEVVLGNENAENHVLIHSGIHGCEYLNYLLLMKQLEYYLGSYDSGSYNGIPYKTLFEKTTFHIVPMVNPDGVTISQFGTDNINNPDLKKSISDCYKKDLQDGYTCDTYKNYLRKWKSNARGVDLNRNFNASWDSIHQSSHPSFENYKGSQYESELETQALVKLTKKYNFTASISYHSSGELIYWDYKDSVNRSECSKIADVAVKVTNYQKALSDSNYSNVVSGGYKDWASSNKTNAVPSITIESGSGVCPLDISEFDNLFKRNVDIWAAYGYYLME